MSTLVKPEHNLADAWATWGTLALLTLKCDTPEQFEMLVTTTVLQTVATLASVGQP